MNPSSINISITLNLTLEQIYHGVTKKIKYKRKKPCLSCENKGGCPTCNGQGIMLMESIEEIEIPKGVASDMTLTFKKKGHFSIQEKKRWSLFSKTKNSKNTIGNLIVKIKTLPHEYFSRENANLIYHCKVSQSELAAGPKLIAIEHLNMEVLNIEIPQNTPSGRILSIGGMGFKDIASKRTGNLMIRLEVV